MDNGREALVSMIFVVTNEDNAARVAERSRRERSPRGLCSRHEDRYGSSSPLVRCRGFAGDPAGARRMGAVACWAGSVTGGIAVTRNGNRWVQLKVWLLLMVELDNISKAGCKSMPCAFWR